MTSRTKGGSGEDGMKKRLLIIKKYCMVDVEPNGDEGEDRNVLSEDELTSQHALADTVGGCEGENDNRNVLDNGEELPTVTAL